MKKIHLLIIFPIFVCSIAFCEIFNGKILLNVNDHLYLLDDVFSKLIVQEWNTSRDQLSEDLPFPSSWDISIGEIKKL